MTTACIVYKTVDLIVKRWSLLIILQIHKGNGKKRYSEIKSALPKITGKVLSTRLKELEIEKIITREIDSKSMPVKTYYQLTPAGKALIKVIHSIKDWGMTWKFSGEECNQIVCKDCTD